jgi:hypothetical protein
LGNLERIAGRTKQADKISKSSIRRSVPREFLPHRTICVTFIHRDGVTIQAMHMDHRTMLGPNVRVQSAETLRRLLSYLGATPAQLSEFDNCNRRWGQGAVQITLAPGHRNLLRWVAPDEEGPLARNA